MDFVATANVDRRLKLLMERVERLEALTASLMEALSDPDPAAVEGCEASSEGPEKPWTALGVSKATYYRRLKEAQ